jgi:hypothetical protein
MKSENDLIKLKNDLEKSINENQVRIYIIIKLFLLYVYMYSLMKFLFF